MQNSSKPLVPCAPETRGAVVVGEEEQDWNPGWLRMMIWVWGGRAVVGGAILWLAVSRTNAKRIGVEVADKVVSLCGALLCVEEDGEEFLVGVVCLVGEDLCEVVWRDAEEAGCVVEGLGVGDGGGDVVEVGVGEEEVAEEEDDDEDGEDGGDVFGLEAECHHACAGRTWRPSCH
jgi:hypothetical protein